jgi:hypothetical protein
MPVASGCSVGLRGLPRLLEDYYLSPLEPPRELPEPKVRLRKYCKYPR